MKQRMKPWRKGPLESVPGSVVPGSAIPGLGVVWLLVALVGMAGAEPRGAACRVHNRLASSTSVGSGTLVDRTDDGRQGLVLTCAHLFTEGVGEVVVSFPAGKTHGAKLVAIDRDADLAALAISNPATECATIDFTWERGERVQACGFGPDGNYRCASGPIVGETAGRGQTSALIGAPVRSGDSGGGVFDAEGHLVAVVWGEAEGVTYASAGEPLRAFMDRVLGRRTRQVYSCPGGVCPRPGLGARPPRGAGVPLGRRPPVGTPPPCCEGCAALVEEIKQRIAALEQSQQARGDYVTRGELAGMGARPPAVPELGVSGLAGWGVVAVTTVGGWLAGRWLRRGVGGRRGDRFP